ncbi:alpha/beta hydrolase [Sphingomonas sp. HITSZ_GF]|uniref:alpha/beta fold hydrolase n=1 Tax=Sphingomonas sp. HITSZ_GF TaxID=3037247 RepID=UPI00240E4856|nr:alpha/beta hydrolase [Sphingomonas sp. HITSZ_GF]MDG2535097.1 alpha/beta hydrolase [Sphingomonas sp. HITSZ_GF]
MIRRIAFALLATASIPAILGAPTAHAMAAPALAETIQMDHLSVQVIGKGSPVILIPGLSSPRAVWDGVAPELAKTHSVYLVQVNGFGGDAPGANLGEGLLPGMLADLHKLIADRKIAGAAVVGHSMGGLLALMLAQAHPGDVGKALIVDALPFVGSAFFPGSTVESVKPQAAAMRAQMAGLYGKPLPEAVGQAIASQNALKPESRAQVAAWMAKADMRVSAQAMYEDLQTDLRPQLKDIAAPVTVLVPWTATRGGEAPVLDLYRREYAGAAKVTVQGVGDSGHFIMLDQPEAFRTALTAWLAG